MIPASSQYAAGIQSEESHNGIYQAPPWFWVGNTSRDEYIGVFFGLAVAYDMIDDPTTKQNVADLYTRMVEFLSGHNWSVTVPGGSSSTTFLIRPDEMLSILQIGYHLNNGHFDNISDSLLFDSMTASVLAPVGVDIVDDNSYFKFSLDYMTFYNLNRLRNSSGSVYEKAYSIVRNHTAGHKNAFFNIVDRALEGPDAARDAETLALLDQWLTRTRRDPYTDLTKVVPVCGSQACSPIPVPLRIPTDFLWQRSPFQLTGGGNNVIETAGLDYILPYWMARYYGLIGPFAVQSSASSVGSVAPESLVSLYGRNLAGTIAQASSTTLPLSLGGISVKVKDAAGTEKMAPLLYVSPTQVNLQVPAGTAAGSAIFTVVNGATNPSAAGIVTNIAPALFSVAGNGSGVAAATAVRFDNRPVAVFSCSTFGISTACTAVPIDVSSPVYLSLYGTGIRNRSSLGNVSATVHGVQVPVLYAGPQSAYVGLDQVNILLPASLNGSGACDVVLMVDGHTANTVGISIQ